MQSPVSALVVKTMVLVAVWCGFSSTAAAQSALTGIVHDQSLLVVVNAKVVVTDAVTGKQLPPAWTNNIGYYELEVAPGDYRIHVEQNGLVYDGMVRVYPNEKAALDITIAYYRIEQLTVPANSLESSTTMTSQAGLGATFNRNAIEASALSNGRVLQSFLTGVPGVVVTESKGTLGQFTADGQQRFANRLTIDGVSGDLAIDVRNLGVGEGGSGVLPAVSTLGGTQTIVPLDAIEQIQVKTTDTTPQNARAPGAQTIVITRAGSDRFAGKGFFDWRPERLGADDWFATGETFKKAPTSSQTGGLSAGGPIVSQQLYYFAAWEHQRIVRPLTATIQVPSLTTRDAASDTVRPLLDAFPAPNGPEDPNTGLASLTGSFPATSTLSSFSLRLDANLNPNNRLFGRINAGSSHGEYVDPYHQLPNMAFSDEEGAHTRTATVGLSSTRGMLANELRLNLSTSRGTSTAGPSPLANGPFPVELFLPSSTSDSMFSTDNTYVSVLSGFGVGSNTIQSGRNTESSQTQVQVADTITWSSRRHDWHFGIDARWAFASATPSTNYSFRGGNFLLGQPRQVTETRVLPARALFSNVAMFVEDKFRASKRLSVSFGVRYEVEPAPTSRNEIQPYLLETGPLAEHEAVHDDSRTRLWNTSWGNIAPRVGATYQFAAGTGHETLLQSGWGLTFDSLSRVGGAAIGGGFPYQSFRLLQVPQTLPVPASVWKVPTPDPFTAGDRNIYFSVPRDFQSPRTYSWQVGIEQALGGTQRLGIVYAGTAGRELPYFYFDNFNLAKVNAFSNDGRSDYNALLAQYVWRLSHGLQVQAVYTWSHAIDLDSGELLQPNPPFSVTAPDLNRASADFDRRHVFQTTASYQLPRLGKDSVISTLVSDWQIDSLVTLRSGAPFTVTATRDLGNGLRFYAYRPDLVAGQQLWLKDASAPGGEVLNPGAFTAPADRTGTLGRNTFQAFPLRQVDLSLSRSIRLGDRVVARLRIDAFNVFNLANFGLPVSDVTTPTVGPFGSPTQSYATALGTGTLFGGGLVPIQQTGGPRSVQIGVKFAF